MKRNHPRFLFAALIIWGITQSGFGQPNPIDFDGKFYAGTIAAPNRYDISAAGDGSILMDISNDALSLRIKYYFLNVTQAYTNDNVKLLTDNTGEGIWANSANRAFTYFSGGDWTGSIGYYSNDCTFQRFFATQNIADWGFDENGKLWVYTSFFIAPIPSLNPIPFPRRILPSGHMGGSTAGNFNYQFPVSAQFCDPASWPELVLATVSGVGPIYVYAHQIFEIGSEARGDGDGRPESGERLELGVKLINMGDQTAELTTAILQAPSSPYVTIVDSSNYWESISGGEIKDNLGSFVFDIDPNLPFDTVVTFQLNISAIGGLWTRTFSIPIFVQDQMQLNAPSHLLARLQSDNASAELTWQDNSNDEDGYKIERRTGATGNWVEIATTGPNLQNYTDTGLLPEVHSYRVRAFKGAAHSDYSNVYSVIIFTRPAPPQNLRAVAGFQQITLKWDPNSEADILRYRIYGGTAANPTTPIDSVEGVNSTNKIISGLSTGATYYFRMTAVNRALLQSDYSNEVSAAPELFTVWPGDSNNDKLVNQADILPLGLHFNRTGPVRQNTLMSWTPQLATAWTPAAATYADANGDGIVNQADVLPIGLHFGKTHAGQISSAERNGVPKILHKTNATTIRTTLTGNTNPGQDFTVDVVVSEITNLFGVSFELLFSPMLLIDPQKAEPGSLMGNDPIFFSNIDQTTGKISIGNTRKSGQGGVTGGGVVARIEIRVSPQAVRGQAITLMLQNVTANDPNAQPIQLAVVPNQIVVVSVESRQNEALPENFALHANTPNPFNPTTVIHYDLPEAGDVTVKIFDLLGKHVRMLVQQQQPAGRYSVIWDGRDESGQIVTSGVFIYQLRAANFVQNRKMILIR